MTLLVGENGSGKSTLVEAIATRPSESSLGEHPIVRRNRKPRSGFFLPAESCYGMASEIERLDADPHRRPAAPPSGHALPDPASPAERPNIGERRGR
ncbi:hypothetical protein GCM10009854_32500 [Saccharopolyspora halophila]|uniref:ATP-binding cassette domain-containing protein n=1 Tax=Saccharopolyspora halophila TaxID=405551 RepID=A0ABN3GI18_9PSEU